MKRRANVWRRLGRCILISTAGAVHGARSDYIFASLCSISALRSVFWLGRHFGPSRKCAGSVASAARPSERRDCKRRRGVTSIAPMVAGLHFDFLLLFPQPDP
jgi:hypothetical protein